jgi:hypothetical protein
VRSNIERAEFFKVIDFYLDKEKVKNQLSANDLLNYQNLDRRDRVVRAANALISMQVERARSLCPNVFSLASIRAALKTRRGKMVMLMGGYIKLMLFLRLFSFAATTLKYAKHFLRK